MKVDLQTLRDLEVIRGERDTATLVDHLDRTSTRGGRRVLARRLTEPLASVEAIHQVQLALQFLMDRPEVSGILPGEEEVEGVVRYGGACPSHGASRVVGTTGSDSRRNAEGLAVATARRSNDEGEPVLPITRRAQGGCMVDPSSLLAHPSVR